MRRGLGIAACILLLLISKDGFVWGAEAEHFKEGVYPIEASLSCYIHAMGGVEFGEPLLISAQLEVKDDDSKVLTLFLGKSNVTIYGVSCDTFVDISPSYVLETDGILSGTLGYYEENGELNTENITYTLSEDTALNAQQEEVHYVSSISFPVTQEREEYLLSLYVNSNVMGTQFTREGYPATVTINWEDTGEDTPGDTLEEEEESGDYAEQKDGLHIYTAQKETQNKTTQEIYAACLNNVVLLRILAVAVLLIVFGAVLMIFGKEKKHER